MRLQVGEVCRRVPHAYTRGEPQVTAQEFLWYLARQGIELWLEEGKLRYRGRRSTLPPGLIEQLRTRKQELIAYLSATAPARDSLTPLSAMQKALWFLHDLNPKSAEYNVALAVRLRGAVAIPILSEALRQLSLRHSVLRSKFMVRDGTPWQYPAMESVARLEVKRAANWSATELQSELCQLAQQPFDLRKDTPVRYVVYERGSDESIFLFCVHHILIDGSSLAILLRELDALYHAVRTGRAAALAPPSAEFYDFVHFQNQLLQSSAGEEQLQYWLQELAGDLPPLDLPTDHPRPPVRSARGASLSFVVDVQQTQALRRLAAQEGTTLFPLMLSAMAVLMHRYTGQDDFLLGTPFHGRTQARFESMVGCCINTLALRARIQPEASFTDLLADLRRRSLAALSHGDYPFPLLVERLCPKRETHRTPLFQVLCAYENFQDVEFLFGATPADLSTAGSPVLFGVPIERIPLQQQEGQFDLSLTLAEVAGGLSCSWSYDSELFVPATIARLRDNFLQLLASILETPNCRISELQVLSAADRDQQVAWQLGPPRPAGEVFLPQAFAAQVARTPHATAVEHNGRTLTYAQLDEQSSRLGRHLRALGAGPHTVIGVCVELSRDLFVALFAILKSGAAYLPLDPSYPLARLTYMLADAQAPILLTQTGLRGQFPEYAGTVCCLDASVGGEAPPDPQSAATHHLESEHQEASKEADQELPRTLPGETLAYVIYTSGSTGKPKGVQITHASLTNLLYSLRDTLGLNERSAVTSLTPVSFDIAGLEIFGPLLCGGRCLVVDRQVVLDSEQLKAWLLAHPPTLLQATPALYRMLLQAGWPGHPELQILSGGEAMPRDLADQLLARGREVWNGYGPTETTIYSTAWKVRSSASAIAVGTPLADTAVYILDSQRQRVPIGVRGEVYIGGGGVAVGYRNKPELTAERFLADPFAGQPEARMYRTGDLGRFNAGGEIELAGRADHQLKLRGFRIEAGEIEQTLREQAGLVDCVVLLRTDRTGESQLVAYVVAGNSGLPGPAELRAKLKERLPEYMIPALFVSLPALPQTPNGKVDRRALPDPLVTPGRLVRMTSRTPPRDESESLLLQLLRDVLQNEEIGVEDDFFELGGHSILATRFVSAIAQRTGTRLPVAALFRHPTVAALAAELRRGVDADPSQVIVPIRTSGSRPPLFLIHPVGGSILCYQELVRAIDSEVPLYAIPALPVPERERLGITTMTALAAHYTAAVRRLRPQGPYQLLGWSMGGLVAFIMAQELRQEAADVPFLLLLDSYAPGVLQGRPIDAEDEFERELQGDLLRQGRQRSELEPAFWQQQFTLFRHNLHLSLEHQTQKYAGQATLLRNVISLRPGDFTHGWAPFCLGGLEVIDIPGDHYSILIREYAEPLGRLISARLLPAPSIPR